MNSFRMSAPGRLHDSSLAAYTLIELCAALLSTRGEAAGVALAAAAFERYHQLNADELLAFFEALAADFDPDAAAVIEAAQQFASIPDDRRGSAARCPTSAGS